MDGSVVGKGEGREEIGWNGMGARSQEEERVWVVRERGADIFFLLFCVGSLGSLLFFPLTHTNLWDSPYLSLPFDCIFSFSEFGIC